MGSMGGGGSVPRAGLPPPPRPTSSNNNQQMVFAEENDLGVDGSSILMFATVGYVGLHFAIRPMLRWGFASFMKPKLYKIQNNTKSGISNDGGSVTALRSKKKEPFYAR